MLIIKCAACRTKLWRYKKFGQGGVLRCHRDRIDKAWCLDERDGKVWCQCGKAVGIDKGSFIKMNKNAFTYTGTKINT
ncbi:MAG: hypothetical protein GX087_02605 [Desulfobulbaceae bacterium]|nr:hypothetical protein [Desulfobulbaceae bacterium]